MSNNDENIKNVTNKSKLTNRTLGLKRWLSFMVTLSMIMSLIILPEIEAYAFSGGSGTASNPYLISTTNDIELLQGVGSASATKGKYYKLTKNLYFDYWQGWSPNGGWNVFAGTFDGDGHELYIDWHNNSHGLFGTLDGATIKNLGIAGTMENPADGDIGVFAMDATGNVTIENCYNRCSVKTSNTADAAGFILETAKGSYVQFTNCYSVGNMEGRRISGFVGYQRGTEVLDSSVLSFYDCYTVGEFSYTSSGLGEYRAPFFFSDGGGLIGTTNCYTDDLGTQGSSGVGSVQCVTGSTMKSASFIRKLGSGFRHDSRNINGGYPILANQKAPITVGFSGTSYNYDGSRKYVTASAKRNDYSCSDSVTSIQGQPSLNSADYTLKYNGSTTAPSAAGTYPVTFELTSTGASYFALSNSPSTTLTINAVNPGQPTNLSFTRQSNGTVKCSWSAPASSGDGSGLTYKVYYGTSSVGMPYTASISSGGTISGLTAGTLYYFKVRATNSSGKYTDSTVVGVRPYPDISYTGQTLVNGTVGKAFSDSVAHATGGYGTTTYALASGSSLPPGLSLASNGTVSGTPTAAGTFSFNVTAKNSGGSKTVTISATIYSALTYNGTTLQTGVQGIAYSQSVATAAGGYGTTTYSTTARPSNPGSAYYSYIPPGLTLSSNGTLSGTPTSSGTYTFEVLALNDGIYKPASFTVTINSSVWFRNPNTLATALRGSSYYQTVGTATGGLGSYKFAVTSGSLPNGLTLTQDGVIQGTAIYSGTYKFTVTVTDTSGSSDSSEFAIAVVDSLSFSGGGGTSDNPYLISTANDLKTMDSMSAGGENFSGKHFKLINDITVSDWDGIDQFHGHFDGNNHVITFKDNCTQGLIAYAESGALIENLGVEGNIYLYNITGDDISGDDISYVYIGGIVGDTYYNGGGVTIKNCYNAADIGADVRNGVMIAIGGIVGEVYGISVENCYNTGILEGIMIDSGANAYVGGISGCGEGGTITNCYNAGYINGGKYTGNIIPYMFSPSDSLINCYGLSGMVNGSDYGTNYEYGDDASEKGNITIKTADEMKSADFVTALGGAFMRDKAMINANANTAGFPLLWMNGAEDVTVEWANMSQEYDGNAKTVVVSAKNSKGRTVMLEDGDYTLTYNGGSNAPSSVGSHVTAVTLTEAGSEYFNIVSGGTSTLTINAGVPGAPTGLATENNEGGSVKLTWTAPEETGGQAIASYNVYYREKAAEGQPEQEWAVINSIEATEYTVTNLTPAKVYEFKVNAYNGAKTGAESEVAEQFVAKEPSAPVIGELISKNAGMVITSVEVSNNFGDAVNKISVYVSRKDEANDTFGEYTKLSDIETETDSTENLLASGLENGVTYFRAKSSFFLPENGR